MKHYAIMQSSSERFAPAAANPGSALVQAYRSICLLIPLLVIASTILAHLGLLRIGSLVALTVGTLAVVGPLLRYRSIRCWWPKLRWDIFALLILIIVAGLQLHSHHAVLDAGRDDGAYYVASLETGTTGSLRSSSPSVATFPGYELRSDGNYASQFAPGYIAYLATFTSVAGEEGIALANTLLLVTALTSVFFVARYLSSPLPAFASMVIFASHYTTVWFGRRTFSEILFLALFWSAFAFILRMRKEGGATTRAVLAIAALPLIRPEAVLYSGSLLAAMTLIGWTPAEIGNAWQRLSTHRVIRLVAPLALASIVGIAIVVGRSSHYRDLVTTLPQFIIERVVALPRLFMSDGPLSFEDYAPRFTMHMLGASYGMTPLFVAGVLGALFASRDRRLLPLYVAAIPSLLFLINPLISPDQPFFVRRFWPVLIPAVIIFGVVAASRSIVPRNRLARQMTYVLFATMVMNNLLVVYPLLSNVEGDELGVELYDFAAELREVGAEAVAFQSGQIGAFAPPLYTLHELETYYLPGGSAFGGKFPPHNPITPGNAAEYLRIDQRQVVIVSSTPPAQAERGAQVTPYFPNEQLSFLMSHELNYDRLKSSCQILSHITGADTRNNIDRAFIEQECFQAPPRSIERVELSLYVYRIQPR